MSRLDRLFSPQWAGGWTLTRVGYALTCLWMHLPRVAGIEDAYAAHDLMWVRPPFNVPNWWVLTPASATGLWLLSIAGLALLLKGGRFAKPGLVLWLITATIFLNHEGLNYKAYDRVAAWMGLAMLFAPIEEKGLHTKHRSPLGRWMMLVFFCGLYATAGFCKATAEPAWWTGEKLALDLVDLHFGSRALGLWLAGMPGLCKLLSIATIAFECAFALLILFRRTNPWMLAGGVLFHAGVSLTMNVGAFSYVCLCAYPVLLHPEVGRSMWERWARSSSAS